LTCRDTKTRRTRIKRWNTRSCSGTSYKDPRSSTNPPIPPPAIVQTPNHPKSHKSLPKRRSSAVSSRWTRLPPDGFVCGALNAIIKIINIL
jgi:hypothetical protein